MHIHIYIYADVTVLFTQELSFLLLYYLYCLCKSVQRSLLQCACRSESESGCKGKEFFVYPPNFSGSFFRWPLLKRVTKDRLPGSAVSIMSFRRRFLSESGCKSSGFRDNRQIYAQLFSYFFLKFSLNNWLSDVFYNMFSLQVTSEKWVIHHIIYINVRMSLSLS